MTTTTPTPRRRTPRGRAPTRSALWTGGVCAALPSVAACPRTYGVLASAEGIRASVLADYCALAKLPVIGALFSWFPAIRDRALADPLFLFKLGVEVFGDAAFSLAAESPGLGGRRGERFTDEAEFFLADVLASAALNASVLTMLSPAVVIGRSPGGGRALRTAARVDGKLNDFLRLLFCRALPPKIPASAAVPGAVHDPKPRPRRRVRASASAASRRWPGSRGGSARTRRARCERLPGSYSDAYAATVAPEAPPLLEPAFEWGAPRARAGTQARSHHRRGAVAREGAPLDGGAKSGGDARVRGRAAGEQRVGRGAVRGVARGGRGVRKGRRVKEHAKTDALSSRGCLPEARGARGNPEGSRG